MRICGASEMLANAKVASVISLSSRKKLPGYEDYSLRLEQKLTSRLAGKKTREFAVEETFQGPGVCKQWMGPIGVCQ